MALVSAEGSFLEVNTALCRLLGRDAVTLRLIFENLASARPQMAYTRTDREQMLENQMGTETTFPFGNKPPTMSSGMA
ncbi:MULTISPECIES: hypothetical protein [unclassified Cyanobium]|uniref:hypothetical protein n=1 Tax=unclassified Cyanobium TaxID=2627006 RepID=UPI0020CC412D|nr:MULTISPECIES: hypothetical protein [unclassified Cyanobium]MCP9860577.1 hypothetical protein [Cyanobium sp. Cruz-8H5]MCP9867801.1 hypothetical protein [Cyanobium sp. Cruz-8D1]